MGRYREQGISLLGVNTLLPYGTPVEVNMWKLSIYLQANSEKFIAVYR